MTPLVWFFFRLNSCVWWMNRSREVACSAVAEAGTAENISENKLKGPTARCRGLYIASLELPFCGSEAVVLRLTLVGQKSSTIHTPGNRPLEELEKTR